MTRADLGDLLTRPGIDRVLDAFQDPYRRLILVHLREGRVSDVDDLLLRGADGAGAELSLEHEHLPKLADAGYVEWDRETGAVERGPAFEEVEPLLDLLERHGDELPPDWP